MIAVGLLGIVALGLTSLLTEMSKQQRAANLKALLASQRLKIESLVKDSTAWSLSVNHANNTGKTAFTCLRSPAVPGPCGDGTTATDLYLVDSQNNLYFNFANAQEGFTTRGLLCSSEGLIYPSNQCPIRWTILVTHTCQSGGSCLSPTTRVVAVPEMPAAQQQYFSMTMNPANYTVDVVRGVGTRFDPILVTEVLPGSGAGPCTGGSVRRNLNTEVQDPAGNVSVGGGQVTFLPGSYQCRITAPAFKVGSHHIEFETSGGTVIGTSAPAISPRRYSVPSNAVLEVAFTISSSTTYAIRHRCQYPNFLMPPLPGETTDTSTQLGFTSETVPANYPSTFVTYATLSCYRNG